MATLLPRRSSASDVPQPAGSGLPGRQAPQKQPAPLGTSTLSVGVGADALEEGVVHREPHGFTEQREDNTVANAWKRASDQIAATNGQVHIAARVTDQGTSTSGSSSDLCVLCYERPHELEMKPCKHSCCSKCMLAILCHCKPNRGVPQPSPPTCPFCRAIISTIECNTP